MTKGKHGAAAARRRQVAESERTVQMAAEIVDLKKRLRSATTEADRVPGLLAEVDLLKSDLTATEGPKVAEIRRWHEDRVAAAEAVADQACDLSKAIFAALDQAGIVVPVIPESLMDFVKVHDLLPAPNRQTRRVRKTSQSAADRKEHVPQDNRRTAAENIDKAMGLTL